MKPITFENLRRLMGGGRKKKDRIGESSFKRSDSFKRISIKRNYLDRGKGRHLQNKAAAQAAAAATTSNASDQATASPTKPPTPSVSPVPDKIPVISTPPPKVTDDTPPEAIVSYDQWMRGMTRSEQEDRPPTPPPRRRSVLGSKTTTTSSDTSRSAESGVDVSKADRSSGLSVSLGRVWMDAPLAMSPRSLELPAGPHRSLDSALKDNLSRPSAAPIARTLSASANTPEPTLAQARNNENISSSKDSGFSFSISIPKLSDFGYGQLNSGGLFRKKRKPAPKPKPSVSRDGYFKRTSRPPSAELYQVVRPTRTNIKPSLDPLVFVAPSRRRPGEPPVLRGSRPILEVRPPPLKAPKQPLPPLPIKTSDHSDSDEGLYECIGPFSGDDEEDSEEEDDVIKQEEAMPRRRPARRTKSQKKNAKYVAAKTGIHRAQSTVRRSRRSARPNTNGEQIIS